MFLLGLVVFPTAIVLGELARRRWRASRALQAIPIEIERKFLVAGTPTTAGVPLRQSYLAFGAPEIRLREQPTGSELTVKGVRRVIAGATIRSEEPLPVSPTIAAALVTLAVGRVEKVRHRAGPWEIDCYGGALAGLQIAEVELLTADAPLPPLPAPWRLGPEVTTDRRFDNASLARHPVVGLEAARVAWRAHPDGALVSRSE